MTRKEAFLRETHAISQQNRKLEDRLADLWPRLFMFVVWTIILHAMFH